MTLKKNFFGFHFAVVTGWETENKYRVRNTLGQQVYFAAERKKLLVCMLMNIISATPIGLGMQIKLSIIVVNYNHQLHGLCSKYTYHTHPCCLLSSYYNTLCTRK